ncbi:hypothetical protein N7513_007275 [Penicillium frequentans]|nr:hypothetical protein N7513_007275 [Penicillium glabrum]
MACILLLFKWGTLARSVKLRPSRLENYGYYVFRQLESETGHLFIDQCMLWGPTGMIKQSQGLCRRRLIFQDDTTIDGTNAPCGESESHSNTDALRDVSGYTKPEMRGNSTPSPDSNTLPPKTARPGNAKVKGVKKIEGIEYCLPIALSTAQVLATVKFAKQEKTQWFNYEDIRKLPGMRRAMKEFNPPWR